MWVKLDDGFATHPKIMKAGPLAAILQIRALCYASQNNTDGLIPASVVPMLLHGFDGIGVFAGGGGFDANELDWPTDMVECGLWDRDNTDYRIHDFHDWNLSKSQRDSFIKKKSLAGKKGMKARWGAKKRTITPVITSAITDDITKPYHAISTSIRSLSVLSPSESEEGKESEKGEVVPDEFEQFWQAYPRKVGKHAAQKAFRNAQNRPAIELLLAAIGKAKGSQQWAKEGGQFIPHPATWLNQGRWADEPVQAPKSVFQDFLERG